MVLNIFYVKILHKYLLFYFSRCYIFLLILFTCLYYYQLGLGCFWNYRPHINYRKYYIKKKSRRIQFMNTITIKILGYTIVTICLKWNNLLVTILQVTSQCICHSHFLSSKVQAVERSPHWLRCFQCAMTWVLQMASKESPKRSATLKSPFWFRSSVCITDANGRW